MKKIIQIVVGMTIIASMTGCASTKAYFVDRGRDAADVFTATVGLGVGAQVRVGPLHAGLLGEIEGYGLRAGSWGDVSRREDGRLTGDLDTLIVPLEGRFGMEALSVYGPPNWDKRRKGFFVSSPMPFVYRSAEHDHPPPLCYYSQIDVVVGLGPSLRLGFNPGELLDFALGWFGIDIYDDDIEMKKHREAKTEHEATEKRIDQNREPHR